MKSPQSFSKTQIVLHWVSAIIIISLLTVGFIMMDMKPNADKWFMYSMHKTFGGFVIFLILARLGLRLTHGVPNHPKDLHFVHKLMSTFSPYVLYAFMIAMAFSGFIMSDAGGYGIKLFHVWPLPHLFTKNPELSKFFREIHGLAAWPFVAVIGLHFFASLFHHFVLKNNLLLRILGKK